MTKKTLSPDQPTETENPTVDATVQPPDQPTETENPQELQDEFAGETKVRTGLNGEIIYTPPHLR
jgi:hypothetical protein